MPLSRDFRIKDRRISTECFLTSILSLITLMALSLIALWDIIPTCKKDIYRSLDIRYTLINQYIADSLAHGLQLGVSLENMGDPSELIQTLKRLDPHIESIRIFAHNDQKALRSRQAYILYATDETMKNMPLPIHWLAHLDQEGPWRFVQNDTSSIGMNICTTYGQTVGGVILTWTHQPYLDMIHRYYIMIALIILGMTGIISGAGYILFKSAHKSMQASLTHMRVLFEHTSSSQRIQPFIPKSDIERQFYAAYKKTKSFYDIMSMIDKNMKEHMPPSLDSTHTQSHEILDHAA